MNVIRLEPNQTLHDLLSPFPNAKRVDMSDLTTYAGEDITCPRCDRVFTAKQDYPATYRVICEEPHRVVVD